MQNGLKYSSLFDLIHTKDDLVRLRDEIDLLEDSLYEVKGQTFDVVCNQLIRKETADMVRWLVAKEEKHKVLEGLKKALEGIRQVEVTVAFWPSEKFLQELWNAVNRGGRYPVIIDIKTDREIIGGATVSCGGRFFDGSLLKTLNDVLKDYV